jgi:D-sedoheptulose 7-phosphate isomerase
MHPSLQQLIEKYPPMEALLPQVQRTYDVLLGCYQRGGQVLICGNGGSASDAEHVVGELMKGYLHKRPVPPELRKALTEGYGPEGAYLADKLQGALPTISLASHTSLITAVVNDIAGDLIFAQQVYGYGRPGDVLMAISTSGASANVLHAVRVAKVRGLTTLGFTGRGGGQLAALADVALCVPADRTADIQERHLALYHAICAMLEEALFPQ